MLSFMDLSHEPAKAAGRNRVTTGPLLALFTAGLLALGACSAASAPEGAAPPAGPSPARPSSTDLPPQVSDSEAQMLWDAEQLLVRDCMARHGFRYWVASWNPIPEDREFPYVVDDLAWARRHSYGSDIQQQIGRLRERNPNRRYLNSLPAERRREAFVAVNGEGPRPGATALRADELEARLPTGGVVRRSAVSCTSQAQRELYGDLRLWYRVTKIVQNVAGIRKGSVIKDRRFAAAVQTWSACMRERGHPYADPGKARAKALSRPPGGPGTRETRAAEIGIAVAEASCAHTTGLSGTARDLDREYARQFTQKYRPDIATERRMRRDALPRAKRILAAG